MPTYGDRYGAGPAFRPGSMALALGLTVLPLAGLVMSLNIAKVIKLPTSIDTYPVAPEPPPPPPDPQPTTKVKTPQIEKIFTPPPVNPPPVSNLPPVDLSPTPPPAPPAGNIGTSLEPVPTVLPTPAAKPVLSDAFVDPHYQNMLQPPYPAEEQRAGNSGRVVVRVLIGIDGRVKQVEKISAASDAFFAATQRQALGKWRFKPATKDGVPIEQWKVMSLRFQIEDQ